MGASDIYSHRTFPSIISISYIDNGILKPGDVISLEIYILFGGVYSQKIARSEWTFCWKKNVGKECLRELLINPFILVCLPFYGCSFCYRCLVVRRNVASWNHIEIVVQIPRHSLQYCISFDPSVGLWGSTQARFPEVWYDWTLSHIRCWRSCPAMQVAVCLFVKKFRETEFTHLCTNLWIQFALLTINIDSEHCWLGYVDLMITIYVPRMITCLIFPLSKEETFLQKELWRLLIFICWLVYFHC